MVPRDMVSGKISDLPHDMVRDKVRIYRATWTS